MTPEQIERSAKATAAAKLLLKHGDKLYVRRCGGGKVTVRFECWERDWIITPTLSDVHAAHIIKVNGKPFSVPA